MYISVCCCFNVLHFPTVYHSIPSSVIVVVIDNACTDMKG